MVYIEFLVSFQSISAHKYVSWKKQRNKWLWNKMRKRVLTEVQTVRRLLVEGKGCQGIPWSSVLLLTWYMIWSHKRSVKNLLLSAEHSIMVSWERERERDEDLRNIWGWHEIPAHQPVEPAMNAQFTCTKGHTCIKKTDSRIFFFLLVKRPTISIKYTHISHLMNSLFILLGQDIFRLHPSWQTARIFHL